MGDICECSQESVRKLTSCEGEVGHCRKGSRCEGMRPRAQMGKRGQEEEARKKPP